MIYTMIATLRYVCPGKFSYISRFIYEAAMFRDAYIGKSKTVNFGNPGINLRVNV